ncbi:valine--pyruvate transaminase [Streptomyces sp. NPDC007070]|uniref:valine--pyruvate transaminase n=1 Tax=Streptomyces sp. NPDC007070 TaxID=3154312 RepID=UPI0034044742
MPLSHIGAKMAHLSGLRSIMDDIATTIGSGERGWLNLSIGNPAPIPEAISAWRGWTQAALGTSFATNSCAYGPSRGAAELVDAIVDYFNGRYGWGITARNVVVGPGSQMLCFIAAALFSGPGPRGNRRLVLPMSPDYTGYQGLSMAADAITGVPARVEPQEGRRFRYAFDFPALRDLDDIGMLLLSSPSNPTGRCVDPDELRELIGLAEHRDAPLFLDHAYGQPFPAVGRTRVDPPWHENVVNCFTVSKAGLPGERIAFAIGPERPVEAMVSFLANSALHAPQLAQNALARALRSGELDTLVTEVITPFYRDRRQLAEKLLDEIMPAAVNWSLHEGEGGLFCWLWIDEPWFDDIELYRLLKRKRVFVVPGRHFCVEGRSDPETAGHDTRCFRISLSPDECVLTEGIVRIAEVLEDMRAGPPPT